MNLFYSEKSKFEEPKFLSIDTFTVVLSKQDPHPNTMDLQ